MRVGIDDPWRQVFSAGIDHPRRGRRIHGFAYGGNLAVLDVNAAIFEVAVSHRYDDGILDDGFVVLNVC